MTDKREDILARLLAIGSELVASGSFVSAVRNRNLLATEARPAYVLLDGGESVKTGGQGRGRPGFAPQVMTMRPEIYILAKEPRPTGKDMTDVNVGIVMNGLRLLVTAAFANDAALLALLGSNGEIVLNGTETDLNSGGALMGEMRLDFAIAYVFDPST